MKVVYIDSDSSNGWAFSKSLKLARNAANCVIVKDRLNFLRLTLDDPITPDYIFIHHNFKDIPCKSLISFIRRQERFDLVKIIVVSDYLTRIDFKAFELLNVCGFMPFKMDLTKSLDQILRNTLIPI